MNERPARVAVVGGGIAGLVTAYRLTRPSPSAPPIEVVLLERSGDLGGVVSTFELGGVRLERGPDSFVTRKPWALDLCRELGLGDDLVHPGATGALVWARGRLVPYPEGSAFGVPSDAESLLRWPGLSMRGRLRAVMDLWRPAARSGAPGEVVDESIASLLTRRLGAECAATLVGPLLAGINSGDPERLSVRATFPELAEWERAFGSLIRGSKATRRAGGRMSSRPVPLFATLRGGLERMVDALVASIGSEPIRRQAPATRLEAMGPGGTIRVRAGGSEADGLDVDAVVLATPATASAELLGGINREAADELRAIPYGSSSVVSLVYPPGTADRLPDATGFIVPAGAALGARTPIVTACTWVSRKWPDPSFGDRAVVRAFAGRVGDDRLAADQLEKVAAVCRDIEAMSPIGDVPDFWEWHAWPDSMPQYEVGHLERVERIERALQETPNLFVTGAAYRGVGIADVVRQANETAERVREHLQTNTARTAASSA